MQHGDGQISRGRAILIVTTIVGGSIAVAALMIWQCHVHGIPLWYPLGALLIVLGVGSTIMNLAVSDERLRAQFGEKYGPQLREQWRGGWVGVLIGAAMIVVTYFLHGW
jgi:hypothetical protein